MRPATLLTGLVSAVLVLSGAPLALAQPMTAAQMLVVGVDYADPANQQPDQHRFFEYADFFSRSVTIHSGDTLDFRFAPASFHVIGLAPSEAAGRAAYPVALLDAEDPVKTVGTGLPKLQLGPSNMPVTGGSTHGGGTIGDNPGSPPACGAVQMSQDPCSFKGGDDVEIAGGIGGFDPVANQPASVDWKITVNAVPGTYSYLCWIHPGMAGTVTVAGADQPTSTQTQIDSQSASQFASERDQALSVEHGLNTPKFSGGAPGTRTYEVTVGADAANGHVDLNEMLPQSLQLTVGDRVDFVWRAAGEVHTVSFPTSDPRLNQPFNLDCGTTIQSPPAGPPAVGQTFQPCLEPGQQAPEFIGDPGTSPSGTALADPGQVVDSGTLAGTGYGLTPSTQRWSVTTTAATQSGTYQYECTVHEGMHGTLLIAATQTPPAQMPPAQIPTLKAAALDPASSGAESAGRAL